MIEPNDRQHSFSGAGIEEALSGGEERMIGMTAMNISEAHRP
jgi:hypothetical protein